MKSTSRNTNGVLAAFRAVSTVFPMVFNSIGTFPCLVELFLLNYLEMIFGELFPDIPIALRALDSARATKDLRVCTPGASPRPVPPGFVIGYRDHTVGELRAQAERNKSTRSLAQKLAALSAIEKIDSGCLRQPCIGQAAYLAHYQQARESIIESFLRTLDASKIARCRNEGVRILQTSDINVVGFVNLDGSTGTGSEVIDAMHRKAIGYEYGFNVRNHLFGFLPSCSTSVTADAGKAHAGKTLLEATLGIQHPEKIQLNTFDGKQIRFPHGPIYDSLVPVPVSSEFLSTGNRHALAARVALLALTFCTSPFFLHSEEQFADSKAAQSDRRHGLAVLRRFGFTRAFIDTTANLEIAKAAAVEHAGRKL